MKKLPARWIPKLSANTWIRIAAGLTVVLAFFVNEVEWVQYRFIQQMELLAYDQRLRLFLPNTLDTRVVVLDIDEKSLNAEGRWPWSRDKVALMIRQTSTACASWDSTSRSPSPTRAPASRPSTSSRRTSSRTIPSTWRP